MSGAKRGHATGIVVLRDRVILGGDKLLLLRRLLYVQPGQSGAAR